MPARKHSSSRGTAAGPKKRTRAGSAARPDPVVMPNQVAVRYCEGQEEKVRDTLSALGTVEPQPSSRILIVHRPSSVPSTKLQAVLDDLLNGKLIEFATPVLHDPDSNTRQVLTDEIVLRLKPGRTDRTLAAVTAEHGVTIGERNEFEPTQYIVKVLHTSGTRTLDVARSLDERDDVEFASPNFLSGIKQS